MFGIGGTELVIILIFGFILFGPDKLPQMGRTIGRAIRQFRNAQEQMNKVVRAEVYDPLSDSEPLKDLTSIFTGESSSASKASSTVSAQQTEQDAKLDRPAPRINAVKPLAPKGETFAQKKARLAREKAERDVERARAQVEASKSEDALRTGDATSMDMSKDAIESQPTQGSNHASEQEAALVKGGKGA